jgi:hypothetical protein
MKRKRIYISGPMTAQTAADFRENVSRFHDCALLIESHTGLKAVNPARSWPCRFSWLYRLMQRVLGSDLAYRLVLCYDLVLLSRSDALCLIDGWQQSRGARIEENFAFRVGIPKTYCYDPNEKKLTQRNEQPKKNYKHKKQ